VLKDLLIDVSKVVGALGVLIAAWISLGGWMPASTAEVHTAIKRIELHLAQNDIDIYSSNVNRLILQGGQIERELKSSPTPSPFLEDQQRVNAEELAGAKNNLFNAQQRALDLAK
jgi:hypothetical protein